MMLTTLVFICIGAPFLLWGGIWWLNTLIFLSRAQETTGLIVDEDVHHTGDGTYHAPIVEFQSPNGQMVRFKEKLGSGAGRDENLGGLLRLVRVLFAVKAGRGRDKIERDMDTVKVVFDPDNPNRARIKSFRYLHFIPLLLITIGVCISMAGIPLFSGFISKLTEFLGNLADGLPRWF
jgi:hypothetical protein